MTLVGGLCAESLASGVPPVLRLQINGRNVTIDYPPTHDPDAVLEAVRAMGPSAVPQAQPGVRGGMRARCRLEGDASDPLAGRFELTCAQWRVTFVRLCPAGACRYAAIDRIYLRPGPPPWKR